MRPLFRPLASTPLTAKQNYEKEKPRAGEFQRFQIKPAAVHKLGHYGLGCSNFEATYKWLTENFNFKASDIMVDDNDNDVGGFMRVNLGVRPRSAFRGGRAHRQGRRATATTTASSSCSCRSSRSTTAASKVGSPPPGFDLPLRQ